MSTKINPEKKVDLPPTGGRNADPITKVPGSHPIETGVGAAATGHSAAWLAAQSVDRWRSYRRGCRSSRRRVCRQGHRRNDRSDDRR